MPKGIVTVFGGTGFLGRRVVGNLLAHDFSVRVASRHPSRASELDRKGTHLEAVRADVNDETSTSAAVEGADGVVNAVSLYVERGENTFHSVHVEAAARLARLSYDAGVEQLVQISGIGSDPNASSRYIRARGEGEEAVRAAFPGAVLIRPAIMFGPDDAFLKPLSDLLGRLPVFVLFGRGQTRLQPVYVNNVAEAVARVMERPVPAVTYELGGPKVYTYRSLVELISSHIGRKRILVPAPFALWRSIAGKAEMLPWSPITRSQVELMQHDNIASNDAPGLASLDVAPVSVETVLAEVIQDLR